MFLFHFSNYGESNLGLQHDSMILYRYATHHRQNIGQFPQELGCPNILPLCSWYSIFTSQSQVRIQHVTYSYLTQQPKVPRFKSSSTEIGPITRQLLKLFKLAPSVRHPLNLLSHSPQSTTAFSFSLIKPFGELYKWTDQCSALGGCRNEVYMSRFQSKLKSIILLKFPTSTPRLRQMLLLSKQWQATFTEF